MRIVGLIVVNNILKQHLTSLPILNESLNPFGVNPGARGVIEPFKEGVITFSHERIMYLVASSPKDITNSTND